MRIILYWYANLVIPFTYILNCIISYTWYKNLCNTMYRAIMMYEIKSIPILLNLVLWSMHAFEEQRFLYASPRKLSSTQNLMFPGLQWHITTIASVRIHRFVTPTRAEIPSLMIINHPCLLALKMNSTPASNPWEFLHNSVPVNHSRLLFSPDFSPWNIKRNYLHDHIIETYARKWNVVNASSNEE